MTPEVVSQAYVKALGRAVANKIVAYRGDDAKTFLASSSAGASLYTVRTVGPKWFQLTCDCMGGNHVACQHRAAVVFARKYGVWAVRESSSLIHPAFEIAA